MSCNLRGATYVWIQRLLGRKKGRETVRGIGLWLRGVVVIVSYVWIFLLLGTEHGGETVRV